MGEHVQQVAQSLTRPKYPQAYQHCPTRQSELCQELFIPWRDVKTAIYTILHY